MRFWIIKGNPARNDLDTMLAPGKVEPWVTRKPPRDWAEGDGVFFRKSAPALRLVGLGRIESIRAPDDGGDSWFDLRYLTGPFEAPLSIAELRADPVVGDASFLKAGAAGTVFPLTDAQARHLLRRLTTANPALRGFAWDDAVAVQPSETPTRALSLRQRWAELVLRGEKTIEARSIRTNIRERVHIYASLGDVDMEDQTSVRREYGLDREPPARGPRRLRRGRRVPAAHRARQPGGSVPGVGGHGVIRVAPGIAGASEATGESDEASAAGVVHAVLSGGDSDAGGHRLSA